MIWGLLWIVEVTSEVGPDEKERAMEKALRKNICKDPEVETIVGCLQNGRTASGWQGE